MLCGIDGVFKNADIPDFSSDVFDIRRPVAAFDADEREQSTLDAPDGPIADGDCGAGNALDDRSHAQVAAAFDAISAGGFKRVSSR